MWTSELARVGRELEGLACNLADHGVLPPKLPPSVNRRDSMAVVRTKETMIALHKRRERLLDELGAVGGSILDPKTLEVLLPGGPVEGSLLSWQPGEPRIAWWRTEPSAASPRRPLPGDACDPVPVLH